MRMVYDPTNSSAYLYLTEHEEGDEKAQGQQPLYDMRGLGPITLVYDRNSCLIGIEFSNAKSTLTAESIIAAEAGTVTRSNSQIAAKALSSARASGD